MLADVVVAMRAALDARGCPVPVYLGEQYLKDNTGCMRVVMVPNADTYSPRDISVRPGTPASAANVGMAISPRSILARVVGVTCHFWAFAEQLGDLQETQVMRDHRVMDALINAFLSSLNGVCQGVMMPSGGTYVLGEAVHDRMGLAYQLQVTIGVPVLDVRWPDGLGFRTEPAHAHVQVKELLGDPQTYQTGAEFDAPDEEEAPSHFPD